ncbi:hypothetical protein CHS0354_043168 [Potamilus streckersoni]|uniref:Hexosyltransferase n=1 Tax=Potamilus streckersoni TaxID=2493646 RepID=A0AAE0SN49_9BIVA|nr:hypothetical protein CHS0354_043168 [Potamilus streckersoni]
MVIDFRVKIEDFQANKAGSMRRKFMVLVLVGTVALIIVFNAGFINLNKFTQGKREAVMEAMVEKFSNFPKVSSSIPVSAKSSFSATQFVLTKSMTESIKKLYSQSWEIVITPYNPKYMIDGRDICNVSPPPFLLFFVLSLPNNTGERQAIRQTWGSVASQSRTSFNISTKLIFVLGRMADGMLPEKVLQEEATKYKDIVQADFVESRHNLTIKMMTGLRWVKTYCPSVKYILKVDDDTFINVALFSDYLLKNPNINNTTIHGYLYPSGRLVRREGKYAVGKEELPSSEYPAYVSGISYILPFDVISDMLDLAERLPYCPVDDAFITGVLRFILDVKIQHFNDFTHVLDTKISPCRFDTQISVTNIDTKCMHTLWNLTTHAESIDCKQVLYYDKNICSIFS